MKILLKLFLLVTLVNFDNSFAQSTVYVQTNQYGRGILKMRGAETFVITPEHLLKNHFGRTTVFGEGNTSQRADLLKSFAGDLAILQFESEAEIVCKKWQLNQQYDNIVENIFEGYLELREKDGSASKVAVSIAGIDVQYITIRPKDYREKFYQGMSGSSLFVQYEGEKVFLGMLQSIEDEETGSVIRADEMDKLLSSFFNPGKQEKRSNVITDQNLTREVQGLKFDLLKINKSSDRIAFTFDVTSLETDKLVKMSWRAIKLFVDDGAEYHPKLITIGNKSYHTVEYNLIREVQVPITIVFNEVSSASSMVTLLNLGIESGNEDFEINFRDLYLGDDTEITEDEGTWSYEDLGLKFELVNVQKNGTNVDASFNVTSLNEDTAIAFTWRDIFLYDNQGLETKPEKITIGNKTYHSVEYNLIQGIKVPLMISFNEVSSSAKNISLLKVNFKKVNTPSVFQIRNLEFSEQSQKPNSPGTIEDSIANDSSTPNCGEIFFYRKYGMLECPEIVYLYNHGELIARLEPGVRFKTIVCDDRSFKFSVRTNPNEIALFSSSPEIQMGNKYYFKISCGMGVSTISLMEDKKGEKDISNNKKFKRRLTEIQLNEY